MDKVYCLYVLDHTFDNSYIFHSIHASKTSALQCFIDMLKKEEITKNSEYCIEEEKVFDYKIRGQKNE